MLKLNCNKIPMKDKGCHFIAGFIIAISVNWFFGPLYAILAGIFVGFAKEAYDKYSYDKADFFDLFATFIGTFVGVVFFNIVVWYAL